MAAFDAGSFSVQAFDQRAFSFGGTGSGENRLNAFQLESKRQRVELDALIRREDEELMIFIGEIDG